MTHPTNTLANLLAVGPLIVARLQAEVPGLSVLLVTDGEAASDLPCVVGAASDQPVALVSFLDSVTEDRAGVVHLLGQDWRIEVAVAGGPATAAPWVDAVITALQGWRPARGVQHGRVQGIRRPRSRQGRGLWPIDMRFGVTSYGTRA